MMMPMMGTSRTRITPQQAKREIARRELAAVSFLDFCRYVDPRFIAAAHVRHIAQKLEQVARYIESGGQEGIGRLMILMPPRHGKTELASIKFPAWLLGRLPDSRVILTSYSAALASRSSRSMRDLVLSDRYQAVFGTRSSMDAPRMLSADSRSVTTWDLAQPHQGGVVAAGIGGSITGMGATLLVVDDPFKDRSEAERQTARDEVDDWYRSTGYTRLEAAGAVIVFHTRWHPDDLAGRLIRKMAMDKDADQWDIVSLPALAEDSYPSVEKQRMMMLDGVFMPLSDPLGRKAGEALWSARFNRDWLLSKKVNSGSYEFLSLYQQQPYSREGNFFRREWFGTVDDGPGERVVQRILDNGVRLVCRVRLWDKAASTDGDFSSGALVSLGMDGIFYIEHIARGQWTTGKRDAKMVEIGKNDYQRFGAITIWHQQDPGSAGVDSAVATNDLLSEAGLYARFEPVSGDKTVRAGVLSSKAEAGRVRLVRGEWNEAFIEECAAFPKGRNDDQVDSVSSALAKLMEIHAEIRSLPDVPDDVVIYEERVSISPV